MNKWPASWRIILILSAIVAGLASGCMPVNDLPADDERDPNFVEGRNHQSAMDFKAAIASFERTVRANPNNAAAHFELGLLYEQNLQDYGSAIYHFQKHQQLRPKSTQDDLVKQHITSCRLELAKGVTFGVVTLEVHRDMQRLTNELFLARRQIETFQQQLAAKPTIVTQWSTLRVTNFVSVPQLVMVTNPVAPVQRVTNTTTQARSNAVVRPSPQTRVSPTKPTGPQAPAPGATAVRPAPKSHLVRPGESMAVIARRYGVTTEKLRAANPSVQPTRMRAGQLLVIPAN